ncbi:MAG TPA: hypothetical protein VFL12_00940 [Thermoanaerobaculia bacterium]|nr:hypothetical protein [Thermoanaerobaculia bacterium]
MAASESSSPAPEPVPGLTNPRAILLERAPIRIRESASTLAGWRLTLTSDGGAGAIHCVEVSPAETFYRGDGVFLGWTQERLAAAYEALRPKPPEERFESPQLG